jgi:hypothetical protein
LSPAEVLGWVTNKLRTPEQLHRIFYAMRFLRRLNRQGYVHFRRWKLYGEMALARQPAVIWLHGDALTVEYEETPVVATSFICSQNRLFESGTDTDTSYLLRSSSTVDRSGRIVSQGIHSLLVLLRATHM